LKSLYYDARSEKHQIPEDGVLTPKHVGVIEYKFTVFICSYVCIFL